VNYLPKSRLGLSALAGLIGFIIGGLVVIYGQALIRDEAWQVSIAAGVSLFVGVYTIDVLSEWIERRKQS
jgi:hypothetical protein